MKISVSIIARNEEKMIGRCLDSIKGADQVVVLDTGSEDQTESICRHHRATVYHYRWGDNFSEARNKCLEYCKGDWVLVIDCDEYLEPGGMDKITQALQFATVKQMVFNMTVSTKAEIFQQPRVFRKCQQIYWRGAAHNYLSRPADSTIKVTVFADISPNHAKDPDRTLRILKKVVEKDPTDSRSMYFLGREYMRHQQADAAVYWLMHHIEITPRCSMVADAYYCLALCYLEMRREAKAVESLHHALMVNENFTDAWGLLSKITKKNKYQEFAKLTDNSNVLTIRK
jgi:glycosyltransferase involved in cell wall biosynthesis